MDLYWPVIIGSLMYRLMEIKCSHLESNKTVKLKLRRNIKYIKMVNFWLYNAATLIFVGAGVARLLDALCLLSFYAFGTALDINTVFLENN